MFKCVPGYIFFLPFLLIILRFLRGLFCSFWDIWQPVTRDVQNQLCQVQKWPEGEQQYENHTAATVNVD